MWTIFKILNFLTVISSAYAWFTTSIPVLTLMVALNVGMIICLIGIPKQVNIDGYLGRILLAFIALITWTIFNQSVGMGIGLVAQYLPVFYLIILPREYQADLLRFVTKWLAISLIPGLIIHLITLFIHLPSLGMVNIEGYLPYDNYIFYIKTTAAHDDWLISRYNSYFPEVGHQAMVCVFLMMANKFDFKENRWLWVILTVVGFSFSLAGYILTLLGFLMLKINSVAKGLAAAVVLVAVVVGIMNFSGGNNAFNQLIIERLQYSETKGIEGNNRFYNNTDYEYNQALKKGDYMTGVSHKANMDLISGAGFKIYILQHGLIGMLLVFLLYLSLIPPRPDRYYTAAFLFLIIMCFLQNAYPGWYAWLFPYVLGLNLNSHQEQTNDGILEYSQEAGFIE